MTELYTIVVDSSFRDKAAYPTAGNYVIHLNNVLKGVASLELTYGMYASAPDVAALPTKYVNMFIDEMQSTLFSNAPAMMGAFTQLPMTESYNTYSALKAYASIKVFEQPLMKLSRLSIKFTLPNGDALTSMPDHLLRFDIRCLRQKEWGDANAFAPKTATSSAVLPPTVPLQIPDPYSVLGVPVNSSMDVVEAGFKKRYKMLQRMEKTPDTLRAKELLKEAFKQIGI